MTGGVCLTVIGYDTGPGTLCLLASTTKAVSRDIDSRQATEFQRSSICSISTFARILPSPTFSDSLKRTIKYVVAHSSLRSADTRHPSEDETYLHSTEELNPQGSVATVSPMSISRNSLQDCSYSNFF
jgi:hypothetical protein